MWARSCRMRTQAAGYEVTLSFEQPGGEYPTGVAETYGFSGQYQPFVIVEDGTGGNTGRRLQQVQHTSLATHDPWYADAHVFRCWHGLSGP